MNISDTFHSPFENFTHNVASIDNSARICPAVTPTVLAKVLRDFPQSLQQIPEQYLKLGEDRLLPHPFQFNIHCQPSTQFYTKLCM